MRNVYLSFLGLVSYNPETDRHDYKPAVYELNGKNRRRPGSCRSPRWNFYAGQISTSPWWRRPENPAMPISKNSVYYGVYEKARQLGYAPIIDMKDFYLINEWADAVGRLVEDADARKMAEVAERTADFQAGELNDESVIRTFDDLTNTIRNVDVNNVAKKADAAVRLIREKERRASATGKILLNLVIDKFVRFAFETPSDNRYDKNYFLVQIELVRLLL